MFYKRPSTNKSFMDTEGHIYWSQCEIQPLKSICFLFLFPAVHSNYWPPGSSVFNIILSICHIASTSQLCVSVNVNQSLTTSKLDTSTRQIFFPPSMVSVQGTQCHISPFTSAQTLAPNDISMSHKSRVDRYFSGKSFTLMRSSGMVG